MSRTRKHVVSPYEFSHGGFDGSPAGAAYTSPAGIQGRDYVILGQGQRLPGPGERIGRGASEIYDGAVMEGRGFLNILGGIFDGVNQYVVQPVMRGLRAAVDLMFPSAFASTTQPHGHGYHSRPMRLNSHHHHGSHAGVNRGVGAAPPIGGLY
jgi:hypothetical protein